MNDKVEWEVVDDAEASQRGNRPPPRPATPQEALKAMLGPWWRWKLAAMFVLGGLALVFVAAVAGIVVVSAIAFALVAIAVMRVRNWLRGTTPRTPDRYR